jgi:cytochrome c oxidase assembly protein subunit 15
LVNNQKRQLIRGIAKLAVILAILVVGLGAYTRLTDAGLGCPDWPGCYGHMLVQSMTAEPQKAWTEMIHRYFAGSLATLTITLAAFTFIWRKTLQLPVALPVTLLGLILFQAALGMWTVTLKLQPTIVMLHLLGGFATLGTLWITYRLARAPSPQPIMAHKNNGFVVFAAITLSFLVLQIALGGWTSANYAALACPGFPTCTNSWLPQSDFKSAFQLWPELGQNYTGGYLDSAARMSIHMMHRLGALISTLLIFSLAHLVMFRIPELKRLAVVLLCLLTLQIGLGITNVLKLLPLGVAVSHNIIAALLLLGMITLLMELKRPRAQVFR